MIRQDSNFLSRKEKELLDEIVRVHKILKKNQIALSGEQYRLFQRAMCQMGFESYRTKDLKDLQVYTTEISKRHKKKDILDMFGVMK